MKSFKIIGVDFDRTLTKDTAWTPDEALRCEPRHEAIARVNELARSAYIIIYTARRDELLPASLEWLRRNNVRYHALSNNKTPFDLIVDDNTINTKDFLEFPEGKVMENVEKAMEGFL